MEIKFIKNVKDRDLSVPAHNIIKNTEKMLDTSVVKFIDSATPTITNYYSVDSLASVTGIGDKTTLGPYSGATKYKLIKDFVVYGYSEEKNTTTERNEKVDVIRTFDPNSFLVLPNTINPKPGDRLTLKLENHKIWYVVTNIDQVTFHNKSYIKVDYNKDDNLPEENWSNQHMVKNKLLTNEYIYIPAHIGTDFSPFLEESSYKDSIELYNYREEINDVYMSYFYDDYTNMLTVDGKDGFKLYFPILTYLQMNYFPLKIYKSNDLMLSNEAIEDKRTLMKWNTSDIVKFLKKRSDKLLYEGIATYMYIYSTDQNNPYYKIDTYMNSMKKYEIYDLTDGETKEEHIFNEIPETIKIILEKWYNDDIPSIKELNNLLSDFYLEDVTVDYLLYVPILLVVIDRIYSDFYESHKSEKFY